MGARAPLLTHFEGKRFNSPNDVVVKSDGTIWFTDPEYGCAVDQFPAPDCPFSRPPDDRSGTGARSPGRVGGGKQFVFPFTMKGPGEFVSNTLHFPVP